MHLSTNTGESQQSKEEANLTHEKYQGNVIAEIWVLWPWLRHQRHLQEQVPEMENINVIKHFPNGWLEAKEDKKG